MLRTLKIVQYKSFSRAVLHLGRLSVLIGANAAGKSNLIDALRLLHEGVREDIKTAVSRRGDKAVLYMGKTWGDAFEIDTEYSASLTGRQLVEYHIQYDWRHEPGHVREESLYIRNLNEPNVVYPVFSARYGRGIEFAEKSVQEVFHTGEPGLLALKAVSYLERFPTVRELRTYIESWQFLQPDVGGIRAPRQDRREERLAPDASNLANVLRTLALSHKETLELIIEDTTSLLGFIEELRVESERGQVALLVRERGHDLETLALSDGTLRLLALLTALHTLPVHGLLCVEEPEHGLHPALFGPLLDLIRTVCPKKGRRQIILTTHSPDLVDYVQADEIQPIERDAEGASILPELDRRQLKRWLKDFRMGELWRMRRIGGMP